MKQQLNTLRSTKSGSNQKISLRGMQVRTSTRAGTDAATCQQCIRGFVAAMAEGLGLTVVK